MIHRIIEMAIGEDVPVQLRNQAIAKFSCWGLGFTYVRGSISHEACSCYYYKTKEDFEIGDFSVYMQGDLVCGEFIFRT